MGTAVPGGEASVFRLTWHPWGSSEIRGAGKAEAPHQLPGPGNPVLPQTPTWREEGEKDPAHPGLTPDSLF